jgi:signal transduction histidine kinase
MKTKPETEKTQILQNLLSQARSEADQLRQKLRKCEQIILSTRLIMGHELKKPATAIGGYLDLALEEADGGRYVDSLDNVQKARSECDLLNELNHFFLELLKVERDEEVLHGDRSTIESFITNIFDHLPEELEARKRVEMDIADEAQSFRVNANAFKVILSNVIENALNYSPKDETVHVEIEKSKDKRGIGNREILKIRVTDHGAGIPKVYLKKIFSPFVRLHPDEISGSGLGLTLVRSLVELCGGDVHIKSGKESGTTVQVTIPEIDNGGESRSQS